MSASSSDHLVTVGVPCHNDAGYLVEALESAIAQTHDKLEILVVDDGSTDDSVAVARSVADARIEVIARSANLGVSATRQEIKERANGGHLVWLDADDRFDSGRVGRLLAAAIEADADLVIDESRFIDPEGRTLPGGRAVPDVVASDRHFTRLFERNVMPPHPLVSRRCFDAVDFDPAIATSEDYDVWLRCVRAGFTFLRVDEIGMDYRVRPGSLSSDPAASRAALRLILAKHDVDDIVELYRTRGFSEAIVAQMACLQLIHRGDPRGALVFAHRPWPDEAGTDRDFYLGTLALFTGDTDLADRHLRRHLDHEPASVAGLNNLGVLIADQGGDGRELWEQAVQLFPGYVDAQANLEGRRSPTPTQLHGDRPR